MLQVLYAHHHFQLDFLSYLANLPIPFCVWPAYKHCPEKCWAGFFPFDVTGGMVCRYENPKQVTGDLISDPPKYMFV